MSGCRCGDGTRPDRREPVQWIGRRGPLFWIPPPRTGGLPTVRVWRTLAERPRLSPCGSGASRASPGPDPGLAERYRSGRNGGASKASCRATGTWVRIPPSPPLVLCNPLKTPDAAPYPPFYPPIRGGWRGTSGTRSRLPAGCSTVAAPTRSDFGPIRCGFGPTRFSMGSPSVISEDFHAADPVDAVSPVPASCFPPVASPGRPESHTRQPMISPKAIQHGCARSPGLRRVRVVRTRGHARRWHALVAENAAPCAMNSKI